MLHQADFLREVENSLSYKPYKESLLATCDENGVLTIEDANKMLADHGHDFEEVLEDPYDSDQIKLRERNAHELLAWLGY
ncbi:hypothetical protein [Prochlorococcus marinus]|uniref:hypothetical protein n=1 Tax=Prochlorococcus marinus TaxID=1219 RepID=UPI0022B468F8|nr:hypothetical protein [Prochlorococcus marinus]